MECPKQFLNNSLAWLVMALITGCAFMLSCLNLAGASTPFDLAGCHMGNPQLSNSALDPPDLVQPTVSQVSSPSIQPTQGLTPHGSDCYKGKLDGIERGCMNKRRVLLSRLGSIPPSCITRCGSCTPCEPVHVPIQPGRKRIGLMEYYPEAWRCKCKNKLYLPGS